MTLQPSEELGPGPGPKQVIPYCDVPQSGWQLSDPPETPPSLAFTVAPLLTSQICFGGPAKHPDSVGAGLTSTPAG
jgi:hypothetical protein